MLILADWFFLVFHTLLVLFNITGWAWKKTRRWNLVALGLTAFSWFVLGLVSGRVGYCICTDWHWQVRRALGYSTDADTYIQFLVETLTGYSPPLLATQWVSGVVFGVSVILSIFLNLRDRAKSNSEV